MTKTEMKSNANIKHSEVKAIKTKSKEEKNQHECFPPKNPKKNPKY